MKRTSLAKRLSQATGMRVIRIAGKKVNWTEVQRKVDRISSQQVVKQDILEALGLARLFSVTSGLTLADVIGATGSDLKAILAVLSPATMVMLLESLTTELRRLNQMAADAEGVSNETAQSLTSGEAQAISKEDFVGGLGMPGAASTQQQQVLPVRAVVERTLQAVLDLHEQAQRNAPVNDGDVSDPRGSDSFPLARNVPRTLEEVEKWAIARADMAEQLNYYPDDDGGMAALGISKANQRVSKQIEKSSVSVPVDSWTGNTQTLAERLVKQQETQYVVENTGPAPWYTRSRR